MKLKVFGVGNEKDYTFVIFAKDKDFFKAFSDVTKQAFGHSCYSHEIEKEAEAGKLKVKRISDYTDRHETCSDDSHGAVFDLFFGNGRVFVVIHAPERATALFMAALEKSAEWPKNIPRKSG
jgi:hypothetical protein